MKLLKVSVLPITHSLHMPMRLSKPILCSLVSTLLLGMTPSWAETWTATCTGDEHVQYQQMKDGPGKLVVQVTSSDGKNHQWQIARLVQTFYNGTAICGEVLENGRGNPDTGQHPISQLCANRSRKTIYVKYKDPINQGPFKSGVYCKAHVAVVDEVAPNAVTLAPAPAPESGSATAEADDEIRLE